MSLKPSVNPPAGVISVNDLHNDALTYNFAVADFETYYVSHERVLVHNYPEVTKSGESGATNTAEFLTQGKAKASDIICITARWK